MENFAVFANGTFWGVFEANTENEAMQAAADAHGTDGGTDGMTAKTLAAYVAEVRAGCASNGADFAELTKEFFNCQEASADNDGNIWIAGPQRGHWLDNESTAELCVWIEGLGA